MSTSAAYIIGGLCLFLAVAVFFMMLHAYFTRNDVSSGSLELHNMLLTQSRRVSGGGGKRRSRRRQQ